MSTQPYRNVAYGLSEPLLNVAQAPIITQRDPTTKDRAQLGTEWINQSTDNVFILVKVEDNVSTWIQVGGGGGTITFDADSGSATPSGGIITMAGAGDISTSASGSTVTFTGSGVETIHTDSGNATASGNAITIAGGNNISTTGSLSTVTVNVSGTSNHQLQVGNASGSLTSLGLATNGQLPIGSTGVNPVLATLTAGAGVSITNGAGSITIAAMGSVPLTFDADSGSAVPAANTITFAGGTGISTSASGSTVTITSTGATPTYVGDSGTATAIADLLHIRTGYGSGTIDGSGTAQFSASTNFVTLILTDASGNTILGTGSVPNTGSPGGTDNTALGDLAMQGAGPFTGSFNTGIGAGCLELITTANNNTAMGYDSGTDLTTGGNNCFYGFHAGNTLTTGINNVFIGYESGGAIISTITGNYNVEIGFEAGVNYTTSESSNVLINSSSTSVVGESHVLRIGNGTGSGNQQLNKAFISGINGVNVGSVASVVSISGDQLGSTTITAGSGVTVTPGANTITIAASGTNTIQSTTITLTSAQVKALKATPIQIVAAQGANTLISPISITSFLSYGGSNVFTAPVSGSSINLYFTNTNTSANITSFAVTATSYVQSTSNYSTSVTSASNPGVPTASCVNQPLYVAIDQAASGEITGNAANDNTITIKLQYFVLTIPL